MQLRLKSVSDSSWGAPRSPLSPKSGPRSSGLWGCRGLDRRPSPCRRGSVRGPQDKVQCAEVKCASHVGLRPPWAITEITEKVMVRREVRFCGKPAGAFSEAVTARWDVLHFQPSLPEASRTSRAREGAHEVLQSHLRFIHDTCTTLALIPNLI